MYRPILQIYMSFLMEHDKALFVRQVWRVNVHERADHYIISSITQFWIFSSCAIALLCLKGVQLSTHLCSCGLWLLRRAPRFGPAGPTCWGSWPASSSPFGSSAKPNGHQRGASCTSGRSHPPAGTSSIHDRLLFGPVHWRQRSPHRRCFRALGPSQAQLGGRPVCHQGPTSDVALPTHCPPSPVPRRLFWWDRAREPLLLHHLLPPCLRPDPAMHGRERYVDRPGARRLQPRAYSLGPADRRNVPSHWSRGHLRQSLWPGPKAGGAPSTPPHRECAIAQPTRHCHGVPRSSRSSCSTHLRALAARQRRLRSCLPDLGRVGPLPAADQHQSFSSRLLGTSLSTSIDSDMLLKLLFMGVVRSNFHMDEFISSGLLSTWCFSFWT